MTINRHRATYFSIPLLALAWLVIGAGAARTVMQTCVPAPINAGQTVNGALSASDCRSPVRGNAFYADRYAFNAPAGAQVAIALASPDFDAYLYLIGPNNAVIAENDDGDSSGGDSRIPAGSGLFSLPAGGDYLIEVTSFSPNRVGDYALSLSVQTAGCAYSIAPSGQTFPFGGGAGGATVTAAPGCAWQTLNSAAWITINSGANGAGAGAVNFTVAPNSGNSPRAATLIIAGQTFTVAQAGCVSIAPTNQSFTANGGSGSFNVTSVNNCSWTAASNQSWLTITSGGGGASSGVVNFSVAPSASYSPRTGRITVSGQIFTVTQAGIVCPPAPISLGQMTNGALTANECRSPFRGDGTFADRYSFSAQAGTQIAISLASSQFDAYLYLIGPNGAVIAENDDGGVGAGNARIPASQFLTLPASGDYLIEATSFGPNGAGSYTLALTSQEPCDYAIAPNSQDFGVDGGTGAVNVTAPQGCAWTAASNDNWITITSGGGGGGNGTVNYSVAANTSANARAGMMTIATKPFTIRQAGAAPVPRIISLSPSSAGAGGPDFTLTVNGGNFTNDVIVRWNGSDRVTTFVSDTQVTARITAADISAAGTATVTAFKPPPGGGSSNTMPFTISLRIARVARVVSANAAPGGAVNLPIELDAQGDENAAGFSLSFDPAALTHMQTTLGGGAAGAALNLNTNMLAQGRLGVALSLSAGQTFPRGARQIVVATFTVASNAPSGATAIGFADQPIGREVISAAGDILDVIFTPGVVVIPGYEADVSPRSNGSNNGTVTIADWVLVGRFAAGVDTPAQGGEFQRADCAPKNALGNGSITISDWVQAGRYAAGLDPNAPAGGPVGPPAASAANLANLAPDDARSRRRDKTGKPRFIRAATAGFESGVVAIELDAQGDENAIGFSLNFDPARWRFASAEVGDAAVRASLNVNASQSAQGFIGAALALPAGETLPAGARQVAIVRFTSVANENADQSNHQSVIEFADYPVPREIVDANAGILPSAYEPEPEVKVTGIVAWRRKPDGSARYEPVAVRDQTSRRIITSPIDPDGENEELALVIFGSGLHPHGAASAITVKIDEVEAPVLDTGPPDVFAGLDQVAVRAPRALIERGVVEIVLAVNGRRAAPVKVRFK